MKIRIYNSVTTQGIAIEYVNQDTTMFLTPFFGAKFVHQPTLLIKKVVGTAETVLYKLPADLKDFKMLGLAVSEGILSVYISGEKRWSGYIGNLDVNMIEKTSLGLALFDDLKILPYRASDSEMKRLYSLRAQIDKQGNMMVPFLTEDTSGVELGNGLKVREVDEVGITKDLIAYYPLEGDARDYSGNGLHGNVVGAVVDEGIRGECYKFDGTSSHIALPGQSYKVEDKITLSAWAHRDNWQDTTSERIISCTENGGWQIGFNDSSSVGSINFSVYISGVGYKVAVYPISNISQQGWHHIVGTFDGVEVKLYFDGFLVDSEVVGGNTIGYHLTNGVFIGAEATTHPTDPTGNYWKGKIQDVRIYHKSLDDREIKILYGMTRPSPKPLQISKDGLVYIAGQLKEV